MNAMVIIKTRTAPIIVATDSRPRNLAQIFDRRSNVSVAMKGKNETAEEDKIDSAPSTDNMENEFEEDMVEDLKDEMFDFNEIDNEYIQADKPQDLEEDDMGKSIEGDDSLKKKIGVDVSYEEVAKAIRTKLKED